MDYATNSLEVRLKELTAERDRILDIKAGHERSLTWCNEELVKNCNFQTDLRKALDFLSGFNDDPYRVKFRADGQVEDAT